MADIRDQCIRPTFDGDFGHEFVARVRQLCRQLRAMIWRDRPALGTLEKDVRL
jgi:hypothetical protein